MMTGVARMAIVGVATLQKVFIGISIHGLLYREQKIEYENGKRYIKQGSQ